MLEGAKKWPRIGGTDMLFPRLRIHEAEMVGRSSCTIDGLHHAVKLIAPVATSKLENTADQIDGPRPACLGELDH